MWIKPKCTSGSPSPVIKNRLSTAVNNTMGTIGFKLLTIDVYKRQVLQRFADGLAQFTRTKTGGCFVHDGCQCLRGIFPVSYTHLDVYKRQLRVNVRLIQGMAALVRHAVQVGEHILRHIMGGNAHIAVPEAGGKGVFRFAQYAVVRVQPRCV